jgi:hypothetical protein
MKRVMLAIALIAFFAWPAVPSAAAKVLSNGTVKSLSATSVTINASGKDTTFSVDAKTKVVGKGVGTKAAAKGKGGRAGIRAATIELTSKARANP